MAGLRHLIVVVPGIGGSVLAEPATMGKPGGIVWDAGFADVANLVRRSAPLSLAENPRLRPVGLIRSHRLLPGWTVVHGYERLVDRLGRVAGATVDSGCPERRNRDADVVLFPYDFRLGIVAAAERLADEVRWRLEHLTATARRGRVVIIAHSMGGLVARYWLGPLGGWPDCRSLITLGTPHRGAPKALRWLVDGVRVGPVLLDTLTDMIRQWPSVAELLPRYPAVWDETTATARYPFELPIPWLSAAARQAFAVHEDIAKAWEDVPRRGTQVLPRIGWSHGTMNAARWDGRRLTVSKDRPSWLNLAGWDEDLGDGTVPAFAAMPLELDGDGPEHYRVKQRHGPLGGAPSMADLALQYERFGTLAPARGAEGKAAAVGLDIEECVPVHTPVPVEVRLSGVDTTGIEPDIWVTVRRHGQPAAVADLKLDVDLTTRTYVGAIEALPAGMYDVDVTARGVPGSADLTAHDSFAVLEI